MEKRPSESSPQQARIRSSSGLKVGAYEAGSRDGAGCAKAMVVADCSRSSGWGNFSGKTIVQTVATFVYWLCSPGSMCSTKRTVRWSHLQIFATGIQRHNSHLHYVFRSEVQWVIVNPAAK